MSSSVVSVFSAVTKLQELAPTELPGTTFLTILIICCLPYFWEDPFLELKGAKGEWKRNGPRKHVAPSVITPQPILVPSIFTISSSRTRGGNGNTGRHSVSLLVNN